MACPPITATACCTSASSAASRPSPAASTLHDSGGMTRNEQASRTDAATHNEDAHRSDVALMPPVDVIEDSTGITLRADLPGVPKDKLKLQVEAGTLTIEGEVS